MKLNVKVRCECGEEITKSNLLRHQRSKKHQDALNTVSPETENTQTDVKTEERSKHKEKMAEYQKVYRIENKDKLKQQKVEYRKKGYVIEKRKLKIVCSCGCEVRKEDIRRHERTKKHQEGLNNLNKVNNVPLQNDNIRANGEETEG